MGKNRDFATLFKLQLGFNFVEYGSRAYVKKYIKELKEIKTYAVCIDTLYKADTMMFLHRDLNYTVKCSQKMVVQLTGIARNLGYNAREVSILPGTGATDAASFAQKKIESTCLMACNLNIFHLPGDLVYHTPCDTVDEIEPDAVKKALHIISAYLLIKDKEVSGET